MRIQHNIAALNSHRQLTANNSAVSKNLEKLSSGYRINRAGDDAAGLAISEKMRAQITGLDTAQKNANDGISLVQTAEGALTEVHSMLNRMVELADQSANGTQQDLVDRQNIQSELNSLRSEIDRISQGTNFNGIKLLDGSMGGAQISSVDGAAATGGAAATKATFDVDLTDMLAGGVATGTDLAIGGVTAASGKEVKGSFKVDLSAYIGDAGTGIADGSTLKVGDKSITGAGGSGDTAAKANAAVKASLEGGDVTLNGKAYTAAVGTDGIVTFTEKTGGAADIEATKAAIAGDVKFGTTGTEAAIGATLNGISAGKAAGALTEDEALAAIKASVEKADAKFAIGGKDYTATLNGKKLTFTAVEAGANTPTAAVIGAAIKNDTTAVADAKVTNIVAGKAEKDPDVDATNATTNISFSAVPKAGDTIKIGDVTYEFVAKDGDAAKGKDNKAVTVGTSSTDTAKKLADYLNANANAAIKDVEIVKDKNGNDTSTITFKTADAAADITKPVTITQEAQGLSLQIGDTADSFNQLSVAIKSMSSASLGIGTGDISVSNQDAAKAAVEKIKTAINTVSSTRGDLGAIQNRLEHTINNLGVTSENMSAAESRIRDVDMAQEMMTFTKNNILTQASQAMLAQANQLPQGVLQLLQ